MTSYNQMVMRKAHELYKANGGGSRDLFAACLSIAHTIIKHRKAHDAQIINLRATRRAHRLNRMRQTAPIGDVLTRAFDEMNFAA